MPFFYSFLWFAFRKIEYELWRNVFSGVHLQSRHRVAGGACIKCCLRGNKIGFQAPHTLAMAKKTVWNNFGIRFEDSSYRAWLLICFYSFSRNWPYIFSLYYWSHGYGAVLKIHVTRVAVLLLQLTLPVTQSFQSVRQPSARMESPLPKGRLFMQRTTLAVWLSVLRIVDLLIVHVLLFPCATVDIFRMYIVTKWRHAY